MCCLGAKKRDNGKYDCCWRPPACFPKEETLKFHNSFVDMSSCGTGGCSNCQSNGPSDDQGGAEVEGKRKVTVQEALTMLQQEFQGRPHPMFAKKLTDLGIAVVQMGHVDQGLHFIRQALDMRQFMARGGDHPEIAQSLCLIASILEMVSAAGNPGEETKQTVAASVSNKGQPAPQAPSTNASPPASRPRGAGNDASGDATEEAKSKSSGSKPSSSVENGTKKDGSSSTAKEGASSTKSADDDDATTDKKKSGDEGEPEPDSRSEEERMRDAILDYKLQALDMRRRMYKNVPAHPELAASLSDVGIILATDGMMEEAVSMLAEALDIRRKLHTEDHADLVASISSLADALHGVERHREGSTLEREAASMRSRMKVRPLPLSEAERKDLDGFFESIVPSQEDAPVPLVVPASKQPKLGKLARITQWLPSTPVGILVALLSIFLVAFLERGVKQYVRNLEAMPTPAAAGGV